MHAWAFRSVCALCHRPPDTCTICNGAYHSLCTPLRAASFRQVLSVHLQTQMQWPLCSSPPHSPLADMDELHISQQSMCDCTAARKLAHERPAEHISTRLQYGQQSLAMLLQEQVGSALGLVKQILERRPDHYVALAQLMSLLRRAGRMAEGEKHLQASLQKVVRGASSAGEQAECLGFLLGLKRVIVGACVGR